MCQVVSCGIWCHNSEGNPKWKRNFLFREVTCESAILQRIYNLRVTAWATEVPDFAATKSWSDEWDAIARHWAFLYKDEPIAAARLGFLCSGAPALQV